MIGCTSVALSTLRDVTAGRTILGSDVVLLSILDGQIELYIQIYCVYNSVLFWQNRAKRPESPEKLTSPWIRRSLAGDKPD